MTSDVQLNRLPIITSWPEDGGPFITLPLVYTTHPDRPGASNLGMYRLHVHDARSTGMHWQIGKGGGFHYSRAEARNEPLPLTVFLGGPPSLILSAVAPLPENIPELMLASLIAGDRLGFATHMEKVNGNAFSQINVALWYAQRATGDAMQKDRFETF